MPDRDRARLARQQRGIREDLAGRADQPPGGVGAPAPPLLFAMPEILGDLRRVLIGRRRRLVLRQDVDDRLVAAVGNADMQPAADHPLRHVAAALAARPDPDQVDRAVADVVVGVAAEVFRREFPVARNQPFLHAAQHLGLALPAVPAVEDQIEKGRELAEIFEKRRRRRVPRGPHRALVVARLRDLDEPPLRAVELRAVGLAEIGHADEPAVGRIAPAVIEAGEDGGAALVVAAHLHAAVAA